MPWREQSVMETRVEFLARATSGKENFSALCREYGISRTTGYERLGRYKATGSILEAASDLSRRPHHSPTKTAEVVENQVEEIRKREGWGARIIEELLRQKGIDLGAATVHRILKRRGLLNPRECHKPALKRFERKSPNELWQMDFKGYYRTDRGICHPLSILDDHSRYLVGLYALPYEKAEEVKPRLITTFERFGMPKSMLMDHGTLWWGTNSALGLTWLSVWLLKQDIDLLYCAVRHPQTQGKVERFHRTMASSIRHKGKPDDLKGWQQFFDTFRDTYNRIRPHEALSMKVPESRYRPSSREYNPHPPEWEYPLGTDVRRLNSQGMVECSGRRYFVCEALSGERVAVERIENLLLVRFRKSYVREINLENEKTRPPKLKNKKTNV
jgi:transposase InsO family protein